MIRIQREYQDLGDRFTILAFHSSDASDFEEYDRLSAYARRRFWNDEPLPFPVLLDDEGETYSSYGISKFPTVMLVGPDGLVVERGSIERFEQALEKLRQELDDR